MREASEQSAVLSDRGEASGRLAGSRRRSQRVLVTMHAARRFSDRVLPPGDPRHADMAWIKRHMAWLVHHSERGNHLRRDPVVGPWLARVGREHAGRPVVPAFHWERQIGFLLVEQRRDPHTVERVVLTCFHCGP